MDSDSKLKQGSPLSALHRHIRLSNWKAARKIMSHHSEELQRDASQIIYDSNTSIVPLSLLENTIGWTSVHFAALHGTTELISWKWMIMKVLEDYNSYLERMESVDNIGCYTEYLGNPFLFRKTKAGHTAPDLFFSKRLHPFPFENLEVRRNAERLLEGIRMILDFDNDELNNEIITDLKTRIEEKMNQEKIRQRRHGTSSSNIIFEREMAGVSVENIDQSIRSIEVDGPQELEHEMALHEHLHEEQEIHIGGQEVPGAHDQLPHFNEEYLDRIADFWHEMELLVMAATRMSLRMIDEQNDMNAEDNINDEWLILHALSIVGCPSEIARLAVKLYPQQLRQRDSNGNLPLHLASLSHKTSSLAEGTWNLGPGRNSSTVPPMMSCLLDVYPEGALEMNSCGRYPINLAILAGKTWMDAVGSLFKAGPNVILSGSLDSVTMLPSCMIAALPRCSSNDDSEGSNNDFLEENCTGAVIGIEEEIRDKQNASKIMRSMWRFKSKVRAEADARIDIEIIQLSTIYELLRIAPDVMFSRLS